MNKSVNTTRGVTVLVLEDCLIMVSTCTKYFMKISWTLSELWSGHNVNTFITKGHNSVNLTCIVIDFLFSAQYLIIVYICTKFHEIS